MRVKDYQEIIEAALDYPEPLTDWEYEFIESISDARSNRLLSKKQEHTLLNIEQKLKEAEML